MKAEIADFLNKQPIFSDFTPTELETISQMLLIADYAKGTQVLTEGKKNDKLFFLEHGVVEILKWDEQHTHLLHIGKLKPGAFFGDMSFVDASLCSTTIKTRTHCKIHYINKHSLNLENPAHKSIYDKLLHNIAEANLQRLRKTSKDYVESMKTSIENLRLQNRFGKFFIIIVVVFGIGNITDELVKNYLFNLKSEFFSWIYLFSIAIPTLYFTKVYAYSLSEFGVTLKNWRLSLRDGVFFSIGMIAFTLLGLTLAGLLNYHPFGLDLTTVKDQRLFNFGIVFGYLIHSYIQEFIIRGVALTSLKTFLRDDSGIKSIILTSAIFAILHLHEGLLVGLIAFIISIPLGIIYLRTYNLIGVTIIHFFLGLIGLYLGIL